MSEQSFITRPMSIALDAVRFASAFMVMLCHAGAPHIYGGNFPLTLRFSHNCVVVFFVLSGLVISASISSPAANLKSYAIARAARIFPVAIPAVIFSGLVFLWLQASKGPVSPDLPSEVARAGLLGMVFLSEGPFGSGVYGNLPYWSLSYEVWYYVLFGAAVFLKGWTRWPVLALLGWLAGVNILIMLPVWLAGVWLNRSAWAKMIAAERALYYLLGCMVAMLLISRWDIAALFALRDLVPFGLGMSEWIISDLAVAGVVVVALAALRPLAERHADWLERHARPIRYASGFSFSLYLFHAPVLAVLVEIGITAGDSVLGLAAILALVTAICAGIAELAERRTPALRRALERLFAPRAKSAALTT